MSKDRCVSGKDTLAVINKTIQCPSHLTTPDGRKIEVGTWEPVVKAGNTPICVTIHGVIRIQEEE